jgi:GNAT superfamily N-acetyltransferase
MNIEIRKLTPDLSDDYVHFFDITPHGDKIDEHRCYCVCWCNDDYEGKDFSSAEKRRDYAVKYIKNNNIQGYLAYYDGKVVGWCNANTKSDCLKCCSWRMFMGSVPTEELSSGIKVKSIFCFTVSPDMKRKGISTKLLERVCQDAVQEGFDFVEAYPNKVFDSEGDDFMGPIELFKRNGFTVYCEIKNQLIMRRQLFHN